VEQPKPDPPTLLRKEILAEARKQSEEILQGAQQEAEALLAKARDEANEIQNQILQQARSEGVRRAESVLATVLVEAGRLRSDAIERLLESIRQEALQRLSVRDRVEYRKAIIALAVEAVRQMEAERFIIRVSVADYTAFGKSVAEDIVRCFGRADLALTVSGDAAIKAAGVIVQDQAGRQIWDNQFGSRLDRGWPELRRQVAIQTGIIALSGTAGGVA
jgi:vacuolar-type H+-ATPase subunit E/Vma4